MKYARKIDPGEIEKIRTLFHFTFSLRFGKNKRRWRRMVGLVVLFVILAGLFFAKMEKFTDKFSRFIEKLIV